MKVCVALLLFILAIGAFAELDIRDENDLNVAKDVIPQDQTDDQTELNEKEDEENQVAEYENDSGDTKDPVEHPIEEDPIEEDPQRIEICPIGPLLLPGTCERRRRRYDPIRRRYDPTRRRYNPNRRRAPPERRRIGTPERRRTAPQQRRRWTWGKR